MPRNDVFTQEEKKQLQDAWRDLERILTIKPVGALIDVQKKDGGDRYLFSGNYTAVLVNMLGREPKLEEIVLLVNSGFPEHGYVCSVNAATKTFSGRIYTE